MLYFSRCWALFKGLWAKQISKLTVKYDMKNMDNDMIAVLERVKKKITPEMLRSADAYIKRVEEGYMI